jgi:hypothetical protein
MTVRKVSDAMTAKLRQIQSQLDRVPQQAYDFWVKTTPKKTGNARRRTRLKGNVIEANYPYAEPLDSGSSRQAPTGMSQPTEKYITQLVQKIMRK